ncbi:2OG-Fe(II) oxygenase [Parerythrobacter jejuensis]|uniref:Prolyl 4-hydroxylase alpha subunit Fe(2+) 2OG dioxygenase domain-containing protein n=1 Tax=Parerythrobacter jejuensis TaxID=795812 RepID=A0A845AQ08_9SPHN|nr:2OG-Fe(II) oxygenase [Parerythrobacter jejuensis]MXP31529.1 hypothetical protein [Parerythrobacter jejuensis]
MSEIAFFDEALDPAFARALVLDARRQLDQGSREWFTNFTWSEKIRRASHPVLIRTYDPRQVAMICQQLEAKGVIEPGHEWRVTNTAWTRLAYIPWHNDTKHAEAVTVYLNEEWDPDWGGLFLWRDGANGAIHAKEPLFNTALRNSGAVLHATTPVMLDAPEPRFTVQLFRQDRD